MEHLQNGGARTAENGKGGGGLAMRVAHSVIRGVLGTLEYSTRGVLSVWNVGCKRTVPAPRDELLYLSAATLAEKIRKAEVSSEAVVRAYIGRIAEVDPLINAVVQGRFEDALEEARFADQLVRSSTLTLSQLADQFPLLGVPFTAKEAILVKGLPSTCGLVCRKGMVADRDSEPVQRMRACGAIPLALTNTSEICMWWETYNKLHGRTSNPYDTTRTAGGSSGGEAALIAAAGSVIGLGTDLGGSIRLPAFFTGIFGHKPSPGIVPKGGQFPPALEEVAPYVAVGPMVRYATDLKLVLSALVGEATTNRLQLLAPVDVHDIKVYYMLDDGGSAEASPVSKEIKDGIKKVTEVLSMEGLIVKEASLKYLKLGFFAWAAYLSHVKDQRISNLMKGEVKNPDEPPKYELWRWLSGKSDHTFPVILNACVQDHVAPHVRKLLDFWTRCGDKIKAELLDLLGSGPSVLLYPTFPHPAAHHGQILANPCNTSYSVVFNAAGVPVTQCPLGRDPGGLPFGVQIVTAPFNDRLSIGLAEYLEKKLGGWTPP